MKTLRRLWLLFVLSLPASAFAGTYIQQNTFTLPLASVGAMDSDAVGNFYALGLPSGAATYSVASYATQGITPLFSFNTGITLPVAFGVESSGIVDLVDGSAGLGAVVLKRFQNNGTLLGQTQFVASSPYFSYQWVATAIDKVNQRIYIAYQYYVHPYCLQCLGCTCPPSGTKGFIDQYDFSGNRLLTITMPGISATSGSCYTPSQLTVDPQGNLYVADAVCQQILKYSPTGSLASQVAASKWTYSFAPRSMWTDAASNLYISGPACGATGCPQSVVKLGSDGSVETSLAADSAAGCAWDSRILYLTSSGGEPLRRMVYNGAPSVAAQAGPLGTVVQHSSSAWLNWQYASDPDGDPIAYSVLISTAATQLTSIGSVSQTSLTSQPLAFGATYFWQLVANDSYLGLPLQATPSPVVSFNLNLVNSPPNNFAVAGGTGTVVTRATSVKLAWQNAVDPDGDPVVYDVLWRPAAQSTQTVVATTAQTYWLMTGLPFGTTFYWSVRARDVYNAARLMAGGVEQPYYPVFQDTPPPVPPITKGTGILAEHALSPQATLAWSNVFDADGDPVAYRLYIGTDPAAPALVQDGTATSYNLSNAQLGTTYYWQVAAYDAYAASTTTVQSLLFVLQDNPPGPVVYVTTATSFAQHTTSPSVTLAWAPSTDPDGDPVSYRLDLQTSSGPWPSVPMGFGTSLTVSTLLETTYFWRVTSIDSFGGASTGAWQSLIVHLANRPPYPIAYTSPAMVTTRATSIALSWQNTGDPDGDPVSYALTLSTGPAAQYQVQQGTSTSYGLTFQFGATYYWSVTATDSFGAQTAGPLQTFVPTFQNSPPPAPPVLSGNGSLGQHTLSPAASLRWSSVIDPDGDTVGYRLYVGTDPAALAQVQDGQGTSYALPNPLFGTTYYWQISAYDPYGGIGTSAVQSLYLFLQNSPPQAFPILSGSGTVSTRNTAQLLSWQNAFDPDGDPVTYDLAVSTLSGALPTVQSSTATSYMLATQFGATYYWQVTARDGFGGATPSGLQTLSIVFRNSPPSIPVNQSKTGTIAYHGFAPSESFFWQPSTDPDGDPFFYSLYMGTDPSHMSVTSPVPLGYAVPNLSLNTAYYFQIVATDDFGAASSSPVNWVYYQFSNNPPGPFDVVAGTGTVVTRATGASLAWTASSDPDGDLVAYRVYLGTAAASLPALQDTTQTTLAIPNLAFGTTYYWRVDAYDGFGGTTTVTEGTQTLLHVFDNPPLGIPNAVTGTGTLSQHTLTPQATLSWSSVSNTEGDPISYRLFLGTSTQSLLAVQNATTTVFALPAPQFGTTYYWQVTAYSPYGASSSSPAEALVLSLQDSPPGVFSAASGTGSLSTRATTQALSWSPSLDPDGDTVTYALRIATWPASMPVVQQSTATNFTLSFAYGTTYYWNVDAFDGFGGTTTISGGTQAFLPLFLNDPPSSLTLSGGFKTSPVVTTMRDAVSLSWEQVTTPQGDPVSYTVYLGDAPNSLGLLARLTPTTDSTGAALNVSSAVLRPTAQATLNGSSIQMTLSNLDYYKTYYLQVAAENPYGATTVTPVQNFSLSAANGFPRAYNYPNPFNPNRGGTNIVFNAPAGGYARAKVEIYSELGDLLSRQEFANIPAGISQVPFGGRDRYGRAFFNGSYPCRVSFEGPGDKATFYMMVVK